ncbi:MAG: hypothetical protein IKX36_09220 [Prevotella sp.]|nr:hypothetical protein [Prevotella sp.]
MRIRKKRKSSTSDESVQELSLFGQEEWTETEEEPTEPPPSVLDDMCWAVTYLRSLNDINSTRVIAMETSMIVQSQWTADQVYVLQSLQGSKLEGRKVASLCYASFMQAFPNMIDHLDLDYYDVYQAALATIGE